MNETIPYHAFERINGGLTIIVDRVSARNVGEAKLSAADGLVTALKLNCGVRAHSRASGASLFVYDRATPLYRLNARAREGEFHVRVSHLTPLGHQHLDSLLPE